MYIDSASGNSAADHNTCQSLALIKYCQIRTKQTRRIEKITEKIRIQKVSEIFEMAWALAPLSAVSAAISYAVYKR